MSINTAIALPGTLYAGSDYFAIYSGDTIRVFEGCPYRGSTYGQQMDYISYNAFYGFPLSEGTQSISQGTYTLDSPSCHGRDTYNHGQIAISSNSLDVPAYMPFKPFYFALSVITFIWVMTFIIKMMWGSR